MYRNVFIIFLVISIFCSCQKKDPPVKEEKETDIVSIVSDEEHSQKYIVSPGTALFINNKNLPLEDIIGTWWAGAPNHTLEIEFTGDNIFYIREFDFNDNFVGEDIHQYKIEENNIVIENIDESKNISKEIIHNLFSSAIIHISELNTKLLNCEELPYRFYRGTFNELLENKNINLSYENKLKEFIYNEVLDRTIFQGDENDENGVIATYGIPVSDEIIEYSDKQRYEGGMSLIGIRELIYEDLTHRYYIFINRNNIEKQFYVDVVVNKKLDRLKMVNIEDTSEKILTVFGNDYWRKDGEDILYMWGGDPTEETYRWVKFSIENNIIIKISYILNSWE
jgi:hypothetical protein